MTTPRSFCPGGEYHSSPGRKPPARSKINTNTVLETGIGSLQEPVSATHGLDHFWKVHLDRFSQAPKQKVLTEMNIQLSNVLSDISGVSGMNIIQAILDGKRDPWELTALVNPGVKATPEDIAKSLEGNWREELLFALRQHVELYRIYQEKIRDCDLQLRQHLARTRHPKTE